LGHDLRDKDCHSFWLRAVPQVTPCDPGHTWYAPRAVGWVTAEGRRRRGALLFAEPPSQAAPGALPVLVMSAVDCSSSTAGSVLSKVRVRGPL
jgi:hypothetical protein